MDIIEKEYNLNNFERLFVREGDQARGMSYTLVLLSH